MTALRFLHGVTLQRERFIEMLPMPRKEHYLSVILSPTEVPRFLASGSVLSSPRHLQHHVRHLKQLPTDYTGERHIVT